MLKWLGYPVLMWLLAGPVVAAVAPAALVVTPHADGTVRPWQQAWMARGYQLKVLTQYRQVDWETLRQFNAVIVTPPKGYDAAGKSRDSWVALPADVQRFAGLLERFAKEGGGVFLFGNCSEQTLQAAMDALTTPLGGRALFELVSDPANVYQQPARARLPYARTTEIARNPLTAGVKAIFYPSRLFLYGPLTSPLQLGGGWQVLVRGAVSAHSLAPFFPGDAHWARFDEAHPGSIPSRSPLIACRQFGKGRVALSGITPLVSLIWEGHPIIEDIALSRGDGITSSGLGRLQDALVRWLAAPSLNSKVLGGYRMPPGEASPPRPPTVVSPVWTPTMGIAGPIEHFEPGIIGARTVLTGGRGTVAAWVTAAKTAGLAWLVFTEAFDQLTPEAWERFAAECAAASDATFTAAPGWEIADVAGNRWVQFGAQLRWPPAGVLDPAGKRIVDAQNAFFSLGATMTAAVAVGHNPFPASSLREYAGLAVVTQEADGSVSDDALTDYRAQQALGDQLRPLAVARLTQPAQLANPALYRNYPLTGRAADWLQTPNPYLPRAFVSNGPRITRWQQFCESRRTYNWVQPGTERWRIHLRAASDVPLTDAVIYDGTALYARYRLDGTTCSLLIDGVHDQQRHLIAVITDAKSRRAISNEIETADSLNRRYMCGDRNNVINGSFQADPATGRPLLWPPGSMQDKYRLYALAPTLPVDFWLLHPPAWDGGIQIATFPIAPSIDSPDAPRAGDYFPRVSCPLASKHMLIQQWDAVEEYKKIDDPVLQRGYYKPFAPLRGCRWQVREVAPVMEPGDLPLTVVETTVRFLSDVTIAAKPWGGLGISLGGVYGRITDGEFTHCAIRADDSPATIVNIGEKKTLNWQGDIQAGGYCQLYPGVVNNTAAMALDDGYRMMAMGQAPGFAQAQVGIGAPGQRFPAGSSQTFRFLAIVTGYGSAPDTSQVEWVREAMGITGNPAYTVKPTQGRVKDTRFFLDLQAEDGGFTGVISEARLPLSRLPIRVYGLNPHWTAAIYDRARKELIPFGFADGIGYASVNTRRGASDVYIGNLVTCTAPKLRLIVVEDSPTKITITAHNPTDTPITTTLRRGRGYERVPDFSRNITVPSGSSVLVSVE
ncbi:MAG: hypothetical protein ACYC7E_19185 [Armatimonadota bacterium]